MTDYRKDLPPRPERIARLPIDERGFPVPWFVHWQDGRPDFRMIGPGKRRTGYSGQCWICGEQRGRYHAFVVGPMCGINRISAEPPSHYECAQYAAMACPFLTRPMAVRNERDLPDERREIGHMIMRNPGVTLVWVTKSFRAVRTHDGKDQVIEIGLPVSVEFYREGRKATRAEIDHSVETGLPILEAEAAAMGPGAVRELRQGRANFKALVDAWERQP